MASIGMGGNVSLGPDGSRMDVCPQLGLQDDPGSYALYPRRDHVCRLEPRQPLDLRVQRTHCLCPAYRTCSRYRTAQPHGLFKPLVVTVPSRRPPRTAVIAMTVIVMIWLTAAVSTAIYIVDLHGSAPHAAWINTSLTTSHIETGLQHADSSRAR